MSFKDIGKYSDLIKDIKNIDKSLDIESQARSIASLINDVSDISEINKIFKNANVGKDLAQKALKDTAVGASESAEAIANMAKATDGLSTSTTIAEGFGNTFKGIGTTMKNTFTSIGTLLAKNPFTSAAIIAGIATATILGQYAETYESLHDTFSESFSDLSSTREDLNNIENQISSTKSKIDELKSVKFPSLVQKGELEKLQQQNDELERSKAILETTEKYQSEISAQQAKKALNKDKLSFAEVQKEHDSVVRGGLKDASEASKNIKVTTVDQNVKENVKSLRDYNKEIEKAEKTQAKLDYNSSGWEKQQNKIEDLKKKSEDLNQALAQDIEDLNSYRSAFVNPDTGKAVTGYEDEVKRIDKALDYYSEFVNGISATKSKKLDKIFGLDEFKASQQKLVDIFRSGKDITLNDITKQFPDLVSACDKAGISVKELYSELQNLATQDTGVTKLEDDFLKFQTSVVSAITVLDSVNASLVNSFSGKGLSLEFDEETGAITGDIANIKAAYEGLEGYNASTLFEKTANGVHLNREALRQLQAQQEALQKKTNLEKIIELQNRLNQAVAEGKNFNQGTEDYNNSQLIINDLKNQLEIAQELSAAYDGATSAYQKWINSQSNGEEGDMFRNVSETMRERGSELYKEGRYNTNEFRAIADYYSDQDLSTAPIEELVRAYESARPVIDKFFTGNKQGIDNFMSEMQRMSDANNLNWVEKLDDGTMKFNVSSKELANALHISQEAVEALFRAADEYMPIRLANDEIADFSSSIEEMQKKADEAKSHLEELSNSNLDLNFNFDSTDVDDLEVQIERAKSNLDQFKNQDGNVDLSINGAEDAVAILQTLIQQKQLVSQPEIMTIDTSSLDEGVSNVISKLQEYQAAVNELNGLNELQAAGIQIDTSQVDDAKAKVDSVFKEIQGMSSDGKLAINADVSVDTSSVEALNKALPEVKAKIVTDTSSLDNNIPKTTDITVNYKKGTQEEPSDMFANVNYKKGGNQEPPEDKIANVNYNKGPLQAPPDDKNAKVNYDKGKQEKPDDKSAKVNYKKGKQENPTSPKTATVNYKLGTVAKPPSVTVKVNYDTSGAPKSSGTSSKKSSGKGTSNGTAHAYGSMNYGSLMYHNYKETMRPAHAGGKWGLKKNEKGAMINELGGEIIVRDGQWFILNDGYPTLANLKQNDIIFNHKQSEQILKNGYITGSHAKLAYGNGSAFSSGSWIMGNIGGGNLKSSGSSSSSTKNKKKTIKSSSTTTPSTNTAEAISDTNEEAEEFEETLDAIEILINRIERQIKNLERVAGSAFNTFEKRNNALREQMSGITQEISAQQQGYERYLQEANSIDLSEDYKNLVRNGAIDISTITDEELSKNIQEFQEW